MLKFPVKMAKFRSLQVLKIVKLISSLSGKNTSSNTTRNKSLMSKSNLLMTVFATRYEIL